jgi:hypothetical protein
MAPASVSGSPSPFSIIFFAVFNISASYLFAFADYDYNHQGVYDITAPSAIPGFGQFSNEKFYGYSGNTILSFAYYIDPADITLSIGVRYQVM